jgi:hypothetical protein
MQTDEQQPETTLELELEKILFSGAKNNDRVGKVEALLNRKIAGKTKWLFEKAIELAEGIWVIKDDDPLKIKYYKRPPDLEAIKYLMDRLLGKPIARVEKKEEKRGVILVEHIIRGLARPAPKAIEGEVVENGITTSSDDIRSGEDAL